MQQRNSSDDRTISELFLLMIDELADITFPMEKAEHSFARLEEVLSQWKGRYNSEISISYGAASNRDHGDIESIIIEADKKMYEYKRNYYMSRGIDRRRR